MLSQKIHLCVGVRYGLAGPRGTWGLCSQGVEGFAQYQGSEWGVTYLSLIVVQNRGSLGWAGDHGDKGLSSVWLCFPSWGNPAGGCESFQKNWPTPLANSWWCYCGTGLARGGWKVVWWGKELSRYPAWKIFRVKQPCLHWWLLFSLSKKLHTPTWTINPGIPQWGKVCWSCIVSGFYKLDSCGSLDKLHEWFSWMSAFLPQRVWYISWCLFLLQHILCVYV